MNQNNLIAEEKEPTIRDVVAAIEDSRKETKKDIAAAIEDSRKEMMKDVKVAIEDSRKETKKDVKVAIEDSKKDLMAAIKGVKDELGKKIDDTNQVVNELVETINDYATNTDRRLDKIEATMVTRDYLDRKMADMKGDLVAMIRDEDKKLGITVETLAGKKVISEDEKKKILSMEPFPKLYV